MNKENKHHRKPRSIGGTDLERNLSYVPVKHHRAWHNIFGNMSAPQIAIKLGKIYPDYFFLAIPKVRLKTIALPENSTSCTKSRKLMDKSLAILFGDRSVKQVVNLVNSRWIDPDFYIHSLKKVSP